jgi:branched-subunit amino acid aminotransferase/4-amino-4-deoxychorismate lyase
VKLGLLEHARYAAHPLAGVKVTSWLENVWAAEKAHNLGFEDIVLLNEHGQVAECTAANLFLVHGNKVSTPSLNSGCLVGVSQPGARPAASGRLYRPASGSLVT